MNKIFTGIFFQFALAAANFAILYYILPGQVARLILAFALSAFGLYAARSARHIFLICTAIAAAAIIVNFRDNLFLCAVFLLIIFSVVPIPYSFAHQTKKEENDFIVRNRKLKEIYDGLLSEHGLYLREKTRLEENIDHIMQLYLIARDFLTNTQIEDSFHTLVNLMSQRAGVKSVNIFDYKNGVWQPVAFSNILRKDDWLKYINEHSKTLERETSPAIIARPVWTDENTNVVYWPLCIENTLLAAVILEVDENLSLDYVEEGVLFAPHVALGAKRINLFGEVRERSRNDGLTGLYLRRYFIERFQAEIQREKRYSGGFGLFMLDIDFFKRINDTYGHLVGDKVLCTVAKTIFNCVRPGDLVGRYGGEEFIALLPRITDEKAGEIALAINKLVREKIYEHEQCKFNVTVSIGISRYPEDGTSIEQLTASADKALYNAKQNGRDRIVFYKDIR